MGEFIDIDLLGNTNNGYKKNEPNDDVAFYLSSPKKIDKKMIDECFENYSVSITGTPNTNQYGDSSVVYQSPENFIIPECIDGCKKFIEKNIETYMCSNYDGDKNAYILVENLSEENLKIMKELMKKDKRYIYNGFRNRFGIEVQGMGDSARKELSELTEPFVVQDTVRYYSESKFLEKFKRIGGPSYLDPFGRIKSGFNPYLENITFSEALEMSGMKHLYVKAEGRIYEKEFYLKMHKRYLCYVKKHNEELKKKYKRKI